MVSNLIIHGTPLRDHTVLYENVVMLWVCALLMKLVVRWSKISGLCYTCELKFIIARCAPRIFFGEGVGWDDREAIYKLRLILKSM